MPATLSPIEKERAQNRSRQFSESGMLDNENALADEEAVIEADRIASLQENQETENENTSEKPGLLRRIWTSIKNFFSGLFKRKRNTETASGVDITSVMPSVSTSSLPQNLINSGRGEISSTDEQRQLMTSRTICETLNENVSEDTIEEIITNTDDGTINDSVGTGYKINENLVGDFENKDNQLIAHKGKIRILGDMYDWESESGVSLGKSDNGKLTSINGVINVDNETCHIAGIKLLLNESGVVLYDVTGNSFSMIQNAFKLEAQFFEKSLENLETFSGSNLKVTVNNSTVSDIYENGKITYNGNRNTPTVTNAEYDLANMSPDAVPVELAHVVKGVEDDKAFLRKRKLTVINNRLVYGYQINNFNKSINVTKKAKIVMPKNQSGFFEYGEDGYIVDRHNEDDIYHLYLLGDMVGPVDLTDQLKSIENINWKDLNEMKGISINDFSLGGVDFSGKLSIDFSKDIYSIKGGIKKAGLFDSKNIDVEFMDDALFVKNFDTDFFIGGKETDAEDKNAQGEENDKGETSYNITIKNLAVKKDSFTFDKSTVAINALEVTDGILLNGTLSMSLNKDYINADIDSSVKFDFEKESGNDKFAIKDGQILNAEIHYNKLLSKDNSDSKLHLGAISGKLSSEKPLQGEFVIDGIISSEFSLSDVVFNNSGVLVTKASFPFSLGEKEEGDKENASAESTDETQEKAEPVVTGLGSVQMNNVIFTKKGVNKNSDNLKVFVYKPAVMGKEIAQSVKLVYGSEGFEGGIQGLGDINFSFINNDFSVSGYELKLGSKNGKRFFGISDADIDADFGMADVHFEGAAVGFGLDFEADNTLVGTTYSKSIAEIFGCNDILPLFSGVKLSKEKGFEFEKIGFRFEVGKEFFSGLVELKNVEILLGKNDTGRMDRFGFSTDLKLNGPFLDNSVKGKVFFALKKDENGLNVSLEKVENAMLGIAEYGNIKIGGIEPVEGQEGHYILKDLLIEVGTEKKEGDEEQDSEKQGISQKSEDVSFFKKLINLMPEVVYGIDECEYVSGDEVPLKIDSSKANFKKINGEKDITDNLKLKVDINLDENKYDVGLEYGVETPKGRKKDPKKTNNIFEAALLEIPILPGLSGKIDFKAFGGYTFDAATNMSFENRIIDMGMNATADGTIGAEIAAKLKLGVPGVNCFNLEGGLAGYGQVDGDARITGATALKFDPEKSFLDAFEFEPSKTNIGYDMNANMSVGLKLVGGLKLPAFLSSDDGGGQKLYKEFTLKSWDIGSVSAVGKIYYNQDQKEFVTYNDAQFKFANADKPDKLEVFNAQVEELGGGLADNEKSMQRIKNIMESYGAVYGLEEYRGKMRENQKEKLLDQINKVYKNAYELAEKSISLLKEQRDNLSDIIGYSDKKATVEERRAINAYNIKRMSAAYSMVNREKEIRGAMKEVIKVLHIFDEVEAEDGKKNKRATCRQIKDRLDGYFKEAGNISISKKKYKQDGGISIPPGSDLAKLMSLDPVAVLSVLHIYMDTNGKNDFYEQFIDRARFLSIQQNNMTEPVMSFIFANNAEKKAQIEGNVDELLAGAKKTKKLNDSNMKIISKIIKKRAGLEKANEKLKKENSEYENLKKDASIEKAQEYDNKIMTNNNEIGKNTAEIHTSTVTLRKKYNIENEKMASDNIEEMLSQTSDGFISTSVMFGTDTMQDEFDKEREKQNNISFLNQYFDFLFTLRHTMLSKYSNMDEEHKIESILSNINADESINDDIISNEIKGANRAYLDSFDDNVSAVNKAIYNYKYSTELYKKLDSMSITPYTSFGSEDVIIQENDILIEAFEFVNSDSDKDNNKLIAQLQAVQ